MPAVCGVKSGRLTAATFARTILAGTVGARDARGTLDLRTKTGIRVEVKSAAHLQHENDNRLPTIGILSPRTGGPDSESGAFRKSVRRPADVFVFAVLAPPAKKDVDRLDVTQWRFYVLRASVLTTKTRSQQSISLATPERLANGWVPYEGLLDDVERAVSGT